MVGSIAGGTPALADRDRVSMERTQGAASEDPALRVLMREYQDGSLDAFRRLHDALAPELRAYLTKLSRDPTRADDLLQETFLQIHRARAAHIPGEAVRPWVFAIAKRVFLMYRRSASRRERYEGLASREDASASLAGTEVARLDARRDAETVLRRVSKDGRRALMLHHLFGLSFKEVGAQLGITAGAAKLRARRAIEAVRKLLGDHYDD